MKGYIVNKSAVKHIFTRALCLILALALACSAYAVEPGLLRSDEYGPLVDIGSPAPDLNVTGMAESGDGFFILNNSEAGVTVSRVEKSDPEGGVTASYTFANADEESITHDGSAGGYAFALRTASYSAGSTMDNGAITTDDAGNVYVALDYRLRTELLYSDLYDMSMYGDFPDCTCTGEVCYDISDCGDCPVCNAFEAFAGSFVPENASMLVIYKLSPMLVPDGDGFAAISCASGAYISASCIEIGSDGSIYVGGCANCDVGFASPVYGYKAFDHSITGGDIDTDSLSRGFIFKVDQGMTSVTASTWLGGLAKYNYFYSSNAPVKAIIEDGGVLYVTGDDCGGRIGEVTGLASSWKNKTQEMDTDAEVYVAKLGTDLGMRAYTYIGGSGYDSAAAMCLAGDVLYLTGNTTSPNLPTHSGAYQPMLDPGTAAAPYNDNFILRISKDLTRDNNYKATYLGGSGREDVYAMALSDTGSVYITGESYGASAYPTTDGSGAVGRITLSRLDGSLSFLEASTVMGSGEEQKEQGRGLAVSGDRVYLAGQTNVGTYMTPAYQMFLKGYSGSLANARIKSVRAYPEGFNLSPVYIGAGETIQIAVEFTGYVRVDSERGVPSLELNLKKSDGGLAQAVYQSGSGTRTLLFSYTIAKGDSTDGQALDCSGSDALKLNGGAILPKSGTEADETDLSVPTGKYQLGYANLHVSTVPQRVTSVSSTIGAGTYGIGAEIPITVSFSQDIATVDTGAGSPTLELSSGGTAVYTGKGMKANELLFTYTVGAGENTNALDCASTAALKTNGAVIKDNYGTVPDFTLPRPGGANSLSAQKTIVINSDLTRIVSVTASRGEGVYPAGSEIKINVRFDRAVTTTGPARLNLNLSSSKVLEAGPVNNQDTLVFTYVSAEGDRVSVAQNSDGYLDYSYEELTFSSGGIQDQRRMPVSCYLPRIGGENSLAAAKIRIDTIAPTAAYFYKQKNGESYYSYYYKSGDRLGVKVQFQEEVRLDPWNCAELHMDFSSQAEGEQSFVLSSAGHGLDAYGNTDPKTVVFEYELSDKDALTNGRITGWHLEKTGYILDEAGNGAAAELLAPADYLWNLYFDSSAPSWADTWVLSASYDESGKKVSLGWPKITDDASGVDTYSVYRRTAGEELWRLLDSRGAFYNSYEDSAVIPGVSYEYAVYATDRAGNVSRALMSAQVGIPGTRPTEDLLAPYWSAGAALSVQRQKSGQALLSWNPVQALDDDGQVAGYRVYQKHGMDWDTQPIAQLDDPSAGEYLVTGISNDDYSYRVTVLDAAGHESALDAAISVLLEYEIPSLLIRDMRTDELQYTFMAWEMEQLPLNDVRVSSVNNEGYRYFYSATGVYLEDILAYLNISDYESLVAESGDTSVSKGFTRAEVEGKGLYYYAPGATESERVPTKPILAYIGVSAENEEPPFIYTMDDLALLKPGMQVVDETPRLLYGQTSVGEVNKNTFVKDVYTLLVDYSGDPLYYQPPVISGVDDSPVYVAQGDAVPADALPEAGQVSAVDAYGVEVDSGRITRSISFQGESVSAVDTGRLGTYLVTYTARDSRGNTASVTKPVIVYPVELESSYDIEIAPDPAGNYTVDESTSAADILVSGSLTGESLVGYSFSVSAEKRFSGSQSVAAVHMRDNAVLSVIAQVGEENVSGMSFEGSFLARAGDRICFYVFDNIDGEKGSASRNLARQSPINSPSDSPLKDKSLESESQLADVELEGVLVPDIWATMKITDKYGTIVFIQSVETDGSGAYRFTMDLSGAELPLDATLSYGQVVETARIKLAGSTEPTPPPVGPVGPGIGGGDSGDASEELDFIDISGHWAEESIRYAASEGIMAGVGGRRFNPNGLLTRAMLVAMLYRMENEPAAVGKSVFVDVEDGLWYSDAIRWAAGHSIVSGYEDDQFLPNRNVSREEMAAIICRYAAYKGYTMPASGDLSIYADAGQISDWAYDSLSRANGAGLIVGRSADTIVPRGTATRAEAAAIITRFCKNIVK